MSLAAALLAAVPAQGSEAKKYDVIVVGASSGGTAAAIEAGRHGMHVALIEETPTLGGIMSNGLSRTDGSPAECTGIYEEFRQRCQKFYLSNAAQDPSLKDYPKALLGYRYEPHVASQVFREMVAESGHVDVYAGRYAIAVTMSGNVVTGVATRSVDDSSEIDFTASVVIDGTAEGDLLPLAHASFRVGRESRTPEEPHAGAIYMTKEGEIFGSGDGDDKLQAYAMLLTIKDYGPGADKTIPRPPGYDPRNYCPEQKSDTWWANGPLPGGKFQLNENMDGTDFTEINWGWVNASREGRRKIWEEYRDLTLGYLYFRQTVMGERSLGLTEDEFPDNGYFPYQLYVREGRRLEGEHIFNERDCIKIPGFPRPPEQRDAIAVGAWKIDSHAVSRDTEGYIFLGAEDRFKISAPIQAPYGVMVPKTVDRLLVPMAVSSTHVGFQVLRLEPIRVAMGQAAGLAASMSVLGRTIPRNIDVGALQEGLLSEGQSLYLYMDVFASTPHFKAIEYAGLAGLDSGYDDFTFRPQQPATLSDASKYLFEAFGLAAKLDVSDMWKVMRWQKRPAIGVQHCTPNLSATYYLLTLRNLGAFDDAELAKLNPSDPITRAELLRWANALGHVDPSAKDAILGPKAGEAGLTRAELAEVAMALLKGRGDKPVTPLEIWLDSYAQARKRAIDTVSLADVAGIVGLISHALSEDRSIFVFGNGGNAATAAHFATDLGKSSSDRVGKRFKVMSLSDNVAWLTAIGNDYSFEDIFVRQLENFAVAGDVALSLSVSGSSPNCVKALKWAREKGLRTAVVVGAKGAEMAGIAERAVVVGSAHYGQVEDVQMEVCHMICYAFIDAPQLLD